MIPDFDLDNLFSYHIPFGTQADRYELIRNAAKLYAQTILDLTPKSSEQTLAIQDVIRLDLVFMYIRKES